MAAAVADFRPAAPTADKITKAGLEVKVDRKYYKLTRSGRATLDASQKRYPLLAKLIPSAEVETA